MVNDQGGQTCVKCEESKILREGYGAVTKQGLWRIRTNQELRKLYKTPFLVADIEQRILVCLGHENRVDQMRTNDISKNKSGGRSIMRGPR